MAALGSRRRCMRLDADHAALELDPVHPDAAQMREQHLGNLHNGHSRRSNTIDHQMSARASIYWPRTRLNHTQRAIAALARGVVAAWPVVCMVVLSRPFLVGWPSWMQRRPFE